MTTPSFEVFAARGFASGLDPMQAAFLQAVIDSPEMLAEIRKQIEFNVPPGCELMTAEEAELFMTFSYALASSSPSTTMVAEHLEREWENLTPDFRDMIREGIYEAIDTGRAGDDFDEGLWGSVLDLPAGDGSVPIRSHARG
ncbi:hypothetical protein [Rhizobium leguminosarum]|uniref:hypothetical protein n=1 Tax=Rhizobium leguminosarum TaxID=384 RepID=UPI002E13FA47|nr:hypothetical protein U8Q02_36260 [Rhizobium leguminosarum]